ncbi:MAG: methyltransferase family protein [Myxococcaceae bacterium]
MSDPAPSSTVSAGRTLFRFRSFTPVPVIIAVGYLLYRTRGDPGPGGETVDALLNVLGVAVALLGQALRFYTLGLVPEGTSGQGNTLEASVLNTRGPYAHVRNPLYVGNLGIVLGLLLVANSPWVYVIGLVFFFGEYFFIIRAEENFLRQKFGAPYEEFLKKVPRWIPRISAAYSGREGLRDRFDVLRAVKKEHNPFAAWASAVVLLQLWELYAREQLSTPQLVMLIGLEVIVVVLFVLAKGFKRGWLFRDRASAS